MNPEMKAAIRQNKNKGHVSMMDAPKFVNEFLHSSPGILTKAMPLIDQYSFHSSRFRVLAPEGPTVGIAIAHLKIKHIHCAYP